MTYEPDQFNQILPFLNGTPDWLILGGPADANEAQTAVKSFPGLKVIAVEPLKSNIEWQQQNGFPSHGILIEAALGRQVGKETLFISPLSDNSHRCSSLAVDHSEGSASQIKVAITTIDLLSCEYGPFFNALLWLDIEGFEYEALQGAEDTLSQVKWVNVELAGRSPFLNKCIEGLLYKAGFTESFIWNQREGFHDRLFRRPSPRVYHFTYADMGSALKDFCNSIKTELTSKLIRCLEVGVYEGASACWLLDNVLVHPQSEYLGVEIGKHHEEAVERAKSNLLINHPLRSQLIIGDSAIELPILNSKERKFELIHIDGCHSLNGCLTDLINGWKILATGGIMIVDDYRRADYGVASAVHQFLSTLEIVTDYEVIYWDYSIAWRKN